MSVTPRSRVAQLLWKARIPSISDRSCFSDPSRIKYIEPKGDDETGKTAVITFEKHSAARTALMVRMFRL
jgi:hypothetical protein